MTINENPNNYPIQGADGKYYPSIAHCMAEGIQGFELLDDITDCYFYHDFQTISVNKLKHSFRKEETTNA